VIIKHSILFGVSIQFHDLLLITRRIGTGVRVDNLINRALARDGSEAMEHRNEVDEKLLVRRDLELLHGKLDKRIVHDIPALQCEFHGTRNFTKLRPLVSSCS
jgi:hypothetical protein